MSNVPDGAQLSDDGNYWWDGNQWQPVNPSGGVDAGTQLGLSGDALAVLSDLDASNLNVFASDELATLTSTLGGLDGLKRLFIEHRHGCWCGPGHICEEERDAMDSCCKTHDNAYDALGVTSGGPGAGGGVDMWSREGLKLTVEADEALVACVDQLSDLDAEGEAYRAGVEAIFGGRASIGRLLRRLPF